MSWRSEELDAVGGAGELQVASRRGDGTLRTYVTIWVVRAGDELFIRSAYGRENGWFRRALASGAGRVRAGGVERDVTFEEADGSTQAAVDRSYHDTYDQHGPAIVNTVVGDKAAPATQRLVAV